MAIRIKKKDREIICLKNNFPSEDIYHLPLNKAFSNNVNIELLSGEKKY